MRVLFVSGRVSGRTAGATCCLLQPQFHPHHAIQPCHHAHAHTLTARCGLGPWGICRGRAAGTLRGGALGPELQGPRSLIPALSMGRAGLPEGAESVVGHLLHPLQHRTPPPPAPPPVAFGRLAPKPSSCRSSTTPPAPRCWPSSCWRSLPQVGVLHGWCWWAKLPAVSPACLHNHR